jgi:hypothetical protein
VQTRARSRGRAAAPIGFALGFLLVAAALLLWRVPPGDGIIGASIVFSSAPTGELTVSPSGPFLTENDLRPTEGANGGVVVRNQTGSRLGVRLRALPSAHDLDHVLRVRVAAGDERVFEGPLVRLRAWTRAFAVGPGESRAIRVRAWIPVATKGFAGRVESIPVELDSRLRRGSA